MMVERKPKEVETPSYSFNGEHLTALQECAPFCPLMPEEEKAWEELKQFLNEQSYQVLCSFIGWDNFLNRTVLTGNIPQFIRYMRSFADKFPSKLYHLTDGGKINTATVVNE